MIFFRKFTTIFTITLVASNLHEILRQNSYAISLQWCHNERGSLWNHQRLDYLFSRFFRRRSKSIKDPRHWPLWGVFSGERWFPAQRPNSAEKWRHQDWKCSWHFTKSISCLMIIWGYLQPWYIIYLYVIPLRLTMVDQCGGYIRHGATKPLATTSFKSSRDFEAPHSHVGKHFRHISTWRQLTWKTAYTHLLNNCGPRIE